MKKSKKSFIIVLVLLLTIGAGIGYAALSQTLNIGGTANIDAMKWNVGFTSAAGETDPSLVSSTATVSTDKKTVTMTCDFSSNLNNYPCVAKVVIKNDSTFTAKLNTITINHDSQYIADAYITESDLSTKITTGKTIAAGDSLTAYVWVKSNITASNLPSSTQSIPVTFTLNWVEA